MVFIDGNNFDNAVSGLYGANQKIDFRKLSELAASKCNGELQKLYYYTAISADKQKAAKTKQFVEHLNKRVPNCIAKTGFLKPEGSRADGSTIYVEKGTDVNIAVDLVSLAYANAYDEAVLFSADSDYEPAIECARRLGKNVVVGVIDKQKAGYIKEICDSHFTLSTQDLDQVKKQ